MKISDIHHFNSGDSSTVVGIGKFDGFHIGHQYLVKRIIRVSRLLNSVPAVFTFKNYPFDTILSLWEEKLEAFKRNGIDLCLWADFSEIYKLQPQDFLDMMRRTCNTSGIVVGENFRFGFRRKGDISFLRRWTKSNHIELSVVKPVVVHNKIVSSSEIKNLIRNSDFRRAALLLGRWFAVKGTSVKGRGIGKTIGFPTINIDLKNKNSPLKEGIYACIVVYKNKPLKGAVFYGSSSTFGLPLSFEIHIIGEKITGVNEGDIFTVIPVKKIREIKTFTTVQNLVNQIKKDIRETEIILNSHKLDDVLKWM